MGRSLGHRAPLLWLVVPFMAGLFWGEPLRHLPAALVFGAAAAAAGLAVLAARLPQGRGGFTWGAAMLLALVLAGVGAYRLQHRTPAGWHELPPREARLAFEVERAFAARASSSSFSGIARVTRADPHLSELVGQRLFFSIPQRFIREAPTRSAQLEATGELTFLAQRPPLRGSFERYLYDSGVHFLLTRCVAGAPISGPAPFYVGCRRVGDWMESTLRKGLEHRPDLASLLAAMMLGRRSALSEAQEERFRQSGTLHLFAISGLHIGALAVAIGSLLTLLRLPRRSAALIGMGTLFFYVQVTGASPSAVRAFIMVAAFWSARSFRLPSNPLAALAAAASIAVAVDPLSVFNAGFQMSYGIVAALLLLGLVLAEEVQEKHPLFSALPVADWQWHHHLRQQLWRALTGLLAIGFSVTLVSTFTSIGIFNLFSPFSFFVNLAVVPLAGLVMTAGLLALIAGALQLGPWVVLFNHAAALVIAVMDRLIVGSLHLPGSVWPASFRADWLGPASLAALLALIFYAYGRGWKIPGRFWSPAALVLALLLFGTVLGQA